MEKVMKNDIVKDMDIENMVLEYFFGIAI